MRLGDPNAQTEWLLGRAGAQLPQFLAHARLRVRDVMRTTFPTANSQDPVRQVGLLMAAAGLDLVPIVDDAGVLCGVLTERALARRYIRESRDASRLDAPTPLAAIVSVLRGRLLVGDDREIRGRVWVQAMDGAAPSRVAAGDVVVVGNRVDAQERAIEAGVSLLVTSNATVPDDRILALARAHGNGGRRVRTRQLRHEPDGHPVGAVPRPARGRPADGRRQRSRRRCRRPDQGRPLPGGGRRRQRRPAARARHPVGPRRAEPPSGAARRPRRARPERPGDRGGGDRRDPRPPPHRLDRDEAPGPGDVRPGRIDGDARGRALPPVRLRAASPDGDDAARRRSLRHGAPDLADDDRPRPPGQRPTSRSCC